MGVAPMVFSKYIFSMLLDGVVCNAERAKRSLGYLVATLCWLLRQVWEFIPPGMFTTPPELTWCCSIVRLWSCRFSTSMKSFKPDTSTMNLVFNMHTLTYLVPNLV
jgi:hypothetical protein